MSTRDTTGAPDAARRGSGRPADGRTSRWERHRERRRAELVDATIRAIRAHGAGVGMDEIAAAAGTSKTVIYRHFGDRAGLYRAVATRVDQRVVHRVSEALASAAGPEGNLQELISSTLEAYLSLVESDPDVYRFVVRPPLGERPLADDLVEETASQVVDRLTEVLAAVGGERSTARVWSLALVGSVQAVADDWLRTSARRPRQELVGVLADLAWAGLSGALGRRAAPDGG